MGDRYGIDDSDDVDEYVDAHDKVVDAATLREADKCFTHPEFFKGARVWASPSHEVALWPGVISNLKDVSLYTPSKEMRIWTKLKKIVLKF
jgi:hypothetical protein